MKVRILTGVAIGVLLLLSLLFLPHFLIALGYLAISSFAVFEISTAFSYNHNHEAGKYYWPELCLLFFAMTVVILCIKNFAIGYVIILCALVDVGGYAAGNLAGKRAHRVKLLQNVSKKKSWEGYVTGVICSVVFGYLLYSYTPLKDHLPEQAKYFCFFAWAPAILGDLFESKLKRCLKIDDSSDCAVEHGNKFIRIIEKPIASHGGYLDRIDSFVFAVVSYQVFLTICRG